MIRTWPTACLLVQLLCGSAVAILANLTVANAQEAFKSPAEAATALAEAARSSDLKRLYAVLGTGGRDILSSGDPIADAGDRLRFVTAYDNRHSISEKGDAATLLIGQDEFSFPIPIVRAGGRWKFDVEAGRKEIVARRIGRNELDAIQVSLAIFDAQQEYAAKDRSGAGAGVYAQRIVSRAGAKDGLYWDSAAGDEPSPLGQLAADAAAEGHSPGEPRRPFHGYFYKILKRQGPSATGGAFDYIANGKMIGGFGLLAYPAEYGRSGVMSFMLNHDGLVYEKDLGPGTSSTAASMQSFNPDKGWKQVTPEKP